MPIELYPNIAKVKRNGVYQNLPGFVQASGDADIKAMIASSETSTTAQYAHTEGSYFILNDVLYKAIIDIAVNDTIAVGTNCEVAILSDDVSDIESDVDDLQTSVNVLEPTATNADVGKALIAKTVSGGKVTEYEFGEAGGEGGTPEIVNTIENVPIASFDDGLAKPVKKIIASIKPVQSGTGDPTSVNERAITGWIGCNVSRTGNNVFGGIDLANAIKAINPSVVTIDETAKTVTFPFTLTSSPIFKSFKTSTRYTFIMVLANSYSGHSATNIGVEYSDGAIANLEKNSSSTNKQTIVYQSTNNKSVKSFNTRAQLGDTTIYYEESGIFEGLLSADDFESYNGAIANITWQTEAGTVYGGKIIINENGSVDLVVEQVKWVENGSRQPDYAVWGEGEDYNCTLFGSFPVALRQADYYGNQDKFICNNRKLVDITSNTQKTSADTFGSYRATGYSFCYSIPKTLSTKQDVAEWFAENPSEVVYLLREPITYHLGSIEVLYTLAGSNNIWGDTGDIIQLEYYADNKKYIDEQDTLIKSLIAPVLNDMIADTSLSANDFRIVNNTLYKITSSISSGGTLTPNTNCVATTIGAVLKSLLT